MHWTELGNIDMCNHASDQCYWAVQLLVDVLAPTDCRAEYVTANEIVRTIQTCINSLGAIDNGGFVAFYGMTHESDKAAAALHRVGLNKAAEVFTVSRSVFERSDPPVDSGQRSE